MILDKELMVSDNQAVTAEADSTNVIDLGIADRGKGEPIDVFAQSNDDWTGTTPTVAVSVLTSADASTWVTLLTGATISAPAAGDVLFNAALPAEGVLRYVKLHYVPGGTTPSGHIDAGLRLDR